MFEVVQRHYIKIYQAYFFVMLCKMYPPLTYYVKLDVKITVKKCLAFAIETAKDD